MEHENLAQRFFRTLRHDGFAFAADSRVWAAWEKGLLCDVYVERQRTLGRRRRVADVVDRVFPKCTVCRIENCHVLPRPFCDEKDWEVIRALFGVRTKRLTTIFYETMEYRVIMMGVMIYTDRDYGRRHPNRTDAWRKSATGRLWREFGLREPQPSTRPTRRPQASSVSPSFPGTFIVLSEVRGDLPRRMREALEQHLRTANQRDIKRIAAALGIRIDE